MTDKTIDLDLHRGMSAQHATELRRLVSEVEVNQAALRRGQEEVERQLLARPAESWPQAAEKARYNCRSPLGRERLRTRSTRTKHSAVSD